MRRQNYRAQGYIAPVVEEDILLPNVLERSWLLLCPVEKLSVVVPRVVMLLSLVSHTKSIELESAPDCSISARSRAEPVSTLAAPGVPNFGALDGAE